MTRHTILITCSLVAACGGASPVPADATQGRPSLAGTWESDCIAASPTQVFRVHFELDASTWKLDYVAFGDTACTAPFLTAHIEGPYDLIEPSRIVANAWDARFAFAKKTLLPHDANAAGFLASEAGCNRPGFVAGVATDVLDAGCAGLGLQPLASCPAELDLAARDGDVLRLGERPADGNLCTPERRPRALSQVALHRR